MARNYEKQYGKLNRLVLKKEKEEQLQHHPTRPKLSQVHTVDEVKKWLPSIKRDIEFNLAQCQVVCYSDDKVVELQHEVNRLEKEYKSFVHKIRRLDPTITQTPWTNRPYESKNNQQNNVEDSIPEKIATPLLDEEDCDDQSENSNLNCCEETLNAPLEFSKSFKPKTISKRPLNVPLEEHHQSSIKERNETLLRVFGLSNQDNNDSKRLRTQKLVSENVGNKLLGLDYSSSDDEEDAPV